MTSELIRPPRAEIPQLKSTLAGKVRLSYLPLADDSDAIFALECISCEEWLVWLQADLCYVCPRCLLDVSPEQARFVAQRTYSLIDLFVKGLPKDPRSDRWAWVKFWRRFPRGAALRG